MPAGTPTGLLGENGSGKSTLLRLIAGEEAPDRGAIEAPGPVGLLHQDLPFPPATTVRCVLDDALAHARRLEDDLARAAAALAEEPGSRAAARDYDELLSRATAADVWDAPRRAEEIVAGLGLGDLPRERPLGRISGGQRERLALCHLLITRPTTLLLDEPTNHLDDAGALPRGAARGPPRPGAGREP
ncbi:ATP-binding cassette domain-containing protein [Brachybacterium nesterenkovii]|uniref:ATP-binding cassette domain-containing protein n=1 Tax=Brachybacterium nesterenkovii TaxID=47847 RepID=UPI00321B0140